jgi:hypothetical protein
MGRGGFLAEHGRLEEGLASAEKAIRLSPRDTEELLRVQPGFSVAFARQVSVWGPAYRDHYLDGLRKAGLKE